MLYALVLILTLATGDTNAYVLDHGLTLSDCTSLATMAPNGDTVQCEAQIMAYPLTLPLTS